MKVEIIEQIMDVKSMSIQKISVPNNLPLNNNISGRVLLNSSKDTIITTNYGLIKLPLIESLAINQNISIGLYDIADRANMVKLQIITDLNNQIYHCIMKKDDINHPLMASEDIVEITEKNINQRFYQVLTIDNFGHKVILSLELNNIALDKVFLDRDNIYINVNDRLYRVIEEVPNLKNILSIGPQFVSLTINQEFNLKENFIHLLTILPQALPMQSLAEFISTLSQTQVSRQDNYLEVYKSVFVSIFNNFRKANLQVRESRSGCNTIRFIFEFETEDGSLSIVDCLYISSTSSLSIVVRSDYELTHDLKARLTASFNRIVSEMSLHGSILFSVQSNEALRQISTHTNNDNYTYSV